LLLDIWLVVLTPIKTIIKMRYNNDDDRIISPYYDDELDEKDDNDDLDYDYYDDDDLPVID